MGGFLNFETRNHALCWPFLSDSSGAGFEGGLSRYHSTRIHNMNGFLTRYSGSASFAVRHAFRSYPAPVFSGFALLNS